MKFFKGIKRGLCLMFLGTLAATAIPSQGAFAAQLEETSQDEYTIDSEMPVLSKALFGQISDEVGTSITLLSNDFKGLSGNNVVVMLDPGHDNKHIGTSHTREDGSKQYEYEATIIIAKACYEVLSQQPGVQVYMTRETDDCPHPNETSSTRDIARRVDYAKSVNADIYISFHLNASTHHGVGGAEVYYPNQSYSMSISNAGKVVAQSLLDSLVSLGLENRGIKTRDSASGSRYPDGNIMDYYELIHDSKSNGFPGIIIEHAFMDYAEDYERYLSTEDKLRLLGQTDAYAIAREIDFLRTAAANYTFDSPPTPEEPVIEDKKEIFNATYYWENNPDIQAAIAKNDTALLEEHFNAFGRKEGRVASPSFDVHSYYYLHPDLRKSFKQDWNMYFEHFDKIGRDEGRVATGATRMLNPTTVYKGKDYSAVYDFNYYVVGDDAKSSINKKYRYDEDEAIKYFVETGMKNGDRGNEAFDITSYYNANPDIRKALKKDWPIYYEHYMAYGRAEGRKASGVDKLEGYVTVYKGQDYSAVYDYNYYLNKYPDLKVAFARDDVTALEHFVIFGMPEGRQANDEFDYTVYRSRYPDLSAAYGNDVKWYYIHYMQIGKPEGRSAKAVQATVSEQNMYRIMGSTHSMCTVDSMMAYFNANGIYPTYYADNGLDAPTLRDFCEIYLEECRTEGVKAEVAFTQAMLETGFLKYTGKVDISKLNFAGIGSTFEEPDGHQFASVREGIRAQVQHLKAYASTDPLINAQVDPRFHLVKRGGAEYVEYLGIQENPNHTGWAQSANYGNNIMTWLRKWINV